MNTHEQTPAATFEFRQTQEPQQETPRPIHTQTFWFNWSSRIPDSFYRAMDDFEQGRLVELDRAMNEPPPTP